MSYPGRIEDAYMKEPEEEPETDFWDEVDDARNQSKEEW